MLWVATVYDENTPSKSNRVVDKISVLKFLSLIAVATTLFGYLSSKYLEITVG